jgi:hypothetical protein
VTVVRPRPRRRLHWEFHRDEVYACSTRNARPYILNIPAGGAPPTTLNPLAPDPTPTNTHERGAPCNTGDTREGLLLGSSASDKKG